MLSLHTSPLAAPGTGDAGGMNVYCVETARELARRGTQVDIFTRATQADQPPRVALAPGVDVVHVSAGPRAAVLKEDLPALVPQFAQELSRGAFGRHEYDLIHSHYWLSGEAGRVLAAEHGIPLVHTMHTMARVKNLSLAQGESPEPAVRERGEAAIVAVADGLIANTALEASQLIELYEADQDRVAIAWPGVDLETFSPGDRAPARAILGVAPDALLLLFVGRIQPLKAPDVLVRAAGLLVRQRPELRQRLIVAIQGGLSGSGLAQPEALSQVAAEEGIADLVRFAPPVSRTELAQWYRAADLVTVPSHNESFGLVALEALACGTPVLAARVGGLPVAVGEAGMLVDGHRAETWAEAITAALQRLSAPEGRARWAARARTHASHFSWAATVDAQENRYRILLGTRGAPSADHPSTGERS